MTGSDTMGYLGLSKTGDSDNASDMTYDAFQAMVKILRKNLKTKANDFNTSGPINVALFLEQYILPIESEIVHSELDDLVLDTITQLDKEIEDAQGSIWDTDENKLWHLKAYRRMRKHLNKIIEEGD